MRAPAGISPRLVQAVLIGLLALGVFVRLYGVLVLKQGFSHDESVSYLCASATEGAYQTGIKELLDTTITVGTIQDFYARPAHLGTGVVAYDLAHWDIHPPLYFWALHAVHVLAGTGLVGGALLNVAAGVLILLLLVALAERVLGGRTAALVVGVIWYLSPAVVQIDLEARQYQFLGLFALASFMIGERLSDGRRSFGPLLAFVAVNTAGMLTHYYFTFLLLPGALTMLMRHRLRSPTLLYFGSFFVSLGLFLLLFPSIFDFVDVFLHREPDPDADDLTATDRLKAVLYASLAFFTYGHWSRYAYLLVSGVFLVFCLLRAWKHAGHFGPWLRTPIGQVTAYLFWACGFTVLLYLMGISPAQAVGEQYFAYIWPALAIVLVYAARKVLPVNLTVVIAAAHITLLAMAFGASVRNSEYVQNALPMSWYDEMAKADLMITDERKRSGLPRICRHLPTGLPLFIIDDQTPLTDGATNIVFLHLDLKKGKAPIMLLDKMRERGYSQKMNEHGHYQLYRFQRQDVLR